MKTKSRMCNKEIEKVIHLKTTGFFNNYEKKSIHKHYGQKYVLTYSHIHRGKENFCESIGMEHIVL